MVAQLRQPQLHLGTCLFLLLGDLALTLLEVGGNCTLPCNDPLTVRGLSFLPLLLELAKRLGPRLVHLHRPDLLIGIREHLEGARLGDFL